MRARIGDGPLAWIGTSGPAALPPFYDGYGIDAPDPSRIDWYALADQLS